MSNSPYNKDYIKSIFAQNYKLKENVTLIVEQLKGKQTHIGEEAFTHQKELEELILRIAQTALNNNQVLTINDLSKKEKKLFFQQVAQIVKAISNKQYKNEEEFLMSIIDEIAQIYIGVLEKRSEKEPDFLSEKDKKRIKEELQRVMEYEIHKKMNPQRLAGETAKENFLNNMQVGGASLAQKHEGKEYMNKMNPKELKTLAKQHKEFQQNFKVVNTSLGQALTPKTPMNKSPQGKNLSKE